MSLPYTFAELKKQAEVVEYQRNQYFQMVSSPSCAPEERKKNALLLWQNSQNNFLHEALRHFRELDKADRDGYWQWQPEGGNDLESLTCPVLISPQDLIAAVRGEGPKELDRYRFVTFDFKDLPAQLEDARKQRDRYAEALALAGLSFADDGTLYAEWFEGDSGVERIPLAEWLERRREAAKQLKTQAHDEDPRVKQGLQKLTESLDSQIARRERAETQLAACAVAATDLNKAEELTPDDYGWSPSFEAVLKLHRAHKQVLTDHPRGDLLEAVVDLNTLKEAASDLIDAIDTDHSVRTAVSESRNALLAVVNDLNAKHWADPRGIATQEGESLSRDDIPVTAPLDGGVESLREDLRALTDKALELATAIKATDGGPGVQRARQELYECLAEMRDRARAAARVDPEKLADFSPAPQSRFADRHRDEKGFEIISKRSGESKGWVLAAEADMEKWRDTWPSSAYHWHGMTWGTYVDRERAQQRQYEPQPPAPVGTSGILHEIHLERARQVDKKGYSVEQDMRYEWNELAQGAAAYCLAQAARNYKGVPRSYVHMTLGDDVSGKTRVTVRIPMDVLAHELWPFDVDGTFNPRDHRRNLIKAAAMIVAEIEATDRRQKALGETIKEINELKKD